MIASERSQNVIVSLTIISAVLSSVLLGGNAMYFGGSYALAAGLDVSIVETLVSGLDPTNESAIPHLSFMFNFQSSSEIEGSVRIKFMGASVRLNDDLLSYLELAYTLPDNLQPLSPHYDRNFTLGAAADESVDRDAIINAYNSAIWNWTVNFRFRFITFDEPNTVTWRYITFQYVNETTVHLV